jgi:probable rRNA maturation factor
VLVVQPEARELDPPRLDVTVVKAVRAPLPPQALRSVLQVALTEPVVADAVEALPQPVAVTVRIAGEREVRRLNRDFLGEDHPTDVLSFPSGTAPEDGYLGDLALSWPAVRSQAAAYGHDPAVEAGLLCVHGLLHLMGWDHTTPGEEAEMTARTLACLALADVYPAPVRLPERDGPPGRRNS